MATVIHDQVQTELSPGRTIFDYADELAVQVPNRVGNPHH